jgi:aconitate hydratase
MIISNNKIVPATPGNKFIQSFTVGSVAYNYFSLPSLESEGYGTVSRLPISIRIVLESLLRNCDGFRVKESDIKALVKWKPNGTREDEIPFVVGRVLLQDFTGVPLGVDLAAMRAAVAELNKAGKTTLSPGIIEPLVPVDLVIDHSVQVDYSSSVDSFSKNLELEFARNQERYKFLKWCQKAFSSFKVIPPGVGICHQVNLEYLAPGLLSRDKVLYPDTLVGTDSHTTMINSLGVVGWGVGGIEAEAAMLGQPVYFLTPDVVGMELSGSLSEGTTATDLVLRVTQVLRSANVVGKFVEFFGDGASSLAVPDRATLSNMAPEYGATVGFFPVDEKTCNYLLATGRQQEDVDRFRKYYELQQLFGIPQSGSIDYSQVIQLDLNTIVPSVAGPKRPQDRLDLTTVKSEFDRLLVAPVADGGFGLTPVSAKNRTSDKVNHGSVLIAAITSCTNTSNPSVMLAAGLLAKKAVEKGLSVNTSVKRSLAPGSRVVSDYLEQTGLQPYLDQLGFNVVGYGCTTCIGNSGPLAPEIDKRVTDNNIIGASVLSGNRNFEARVHQNVKANFLMSPPLVVAFAIAGRVDIDFETEPLGTDKAGKHVFLRDIWPTVAEVGQQLQSAFDVETYRVRYGECHKGGADWSKIPEHASQTYSWETDSTYIQHPPYFESFSTEPKPITDIINARSLAIFGDSITTDHISPAGEIAPLSAAGKYLKKNGISPSDFNSYGARRGNHEVMIRGTFGNVRIRNFMIPKSEGSVTRHYPSGSELSIYDAAQKYKETQTPLVIIAGKEYGTGSSRDWAAKGTALLGVRAVIASGYERIHRSNLLGMGVLPLQFIDSMTSTSLGLKGDELFSITNITANLQPRSTLLVNIVSTDGTKKDIEVLIRIDTSIEVEYYQNGGILQYVLRQLLEKQEVTG